MLFLSCVRSCFTLSQCGFQAVFQVVFNAVFKLFSLVFQAVFNSVFKLSSLVFLAVFNAVFKLFSFVFQVVSSAVFNAVSIRVCRERCSRGFKQRVDSQGHEQEQEGDWARENWPNIWASFPSSNKACRCVHDFVQHLRCPYGFFSARF